MNCSLSLRIGDPRRVSKATDVRASKTYVNTPLTWTAAPFSTLCSSYHNLDEDSALPSCLALLTSSHCDAWSHCDTWRHSPSGMHGSLPDLCIRGRAPGDQGQEGTMQGDI